MGHYRHELKFYITEQEAALLSTRLKNTMRLDKHALAQGGSYFIRSLYFDNPYDSGVTEKVAGIQFRDKFRIRIYNLSDSIIKLERKHKNGQFIKKDSINLTRNQCNAILTGEYDFLLRLQNPMAREFYAELRTKGLKPKVLVDYDREPFTFPVEDVRVTIDRNVRTSMRPQDLFDEYAITYPAMERADCCILEIKFNRYLPSYIRGLVQLDAANHVAASKYLFCRQFD